jgi:23S rRNA (pseudouridine1915-N3)-methyltransferase
MRLPGTLTIAAVGKLRTPHWQSAQRDYLQRLQRYVNLVLVEVRDLAGSTLPDDTAIAREGQALSQAVKDVPWTIALDATGPQLDSEGLADYLRRHVETYRDLAFLIGGPIGLSPDVLAGCSARLSLSRLTLPHELARIVLLEQLYRAMTILGGEPYHK